MGMYKQPLLILFWETLTFWNPVAKFDIAPKNRCWTAAEYQYSVIYFISRKHQKKWENHFSLHQRDRWTLKLALDGNLKPQKRQAQGKAASGRSRHSCWMWILFASLVVVNWPQYYAVIQNMPDKAGPGMFCHFLLFCDTGADKSVYYSGVSGNSRFPWFPGIQASNFPSLPFPWHFKFSLPVPGKRKFWTGIRTGNTIIICSFEHFLMCSLYVEKE